MNDDPNGRRQAILVTTVLLSVCLQIAGASLVKYASLPKDPDPGMLLALILAVLALNFARLLIWNFIHKRYPLSVAYPLSALLLPAVLLVAWLMGETIGWMQIAGGLVVTAGVFVILASERSQAPHFPPED